MLLSPIWGNKGESSEAKTAANQAFQLLTNMPSIWIKIQAQTLPWARDAESESCTVMLDSLQPHGLYSPWNSPGQNTEVGSHSLLQGIVPTQVSCIAGGFFTSWATREAHRDTEWKHRMTLLCSWEGLQGLSYPGFLFCTLGSRG